MSMASPQSFGEEPWLTAGAPLHEPPHQFLLGLACRMVSFDAPMLKNHLPVLHPLDKYSAGALI